jgi:7-cyano-7-deazaguanine synthase in queuosine biosynthesis
VAAYYLRTLKADHPEARTVFIGNSPDDTFPHSQLAAIRSANIVVCVDQADWSIQVASPLLEPALWGAIDKRALVELAISWHVQIDRTHTCTVSIEPCGTCAECLLRLKHLAR